MNNIISIIILLFVVKLNGQNVGSGVTDIDGNNYNTVIIGEQEWMSENLKTTKYCNGDGLPINNNNSTGTWGNLTVGAWNISPNYPNNGKFYNWYAVADNRNICPCNWHVPSDSEWTILENYLIANGFNYDGSTSGNKIGKALASQNPTQNINWTSSTNLGAVGNNTALNNSSGFNATPEGFLFAETNSSIGIYSSMWTSTEANSSCSWVRSIGNAYTVLGRLNCDLGEKTFGLSIRCIKNNPLNINSQSKSSFNIYPNPTNNFVNINITTQDLPSEYIIYENSGKKLNRGIINSENTSINVSELQSGIYFITISTKTKSKTQKFIKL